MGVHQAAEQAAEVLGEPFWEGAIPFPGSVMSRFVAAFVADFDLKDSCSARWWRNWSQSCRVSCRDEGKSGRFDWC